MSKRTRLEHITPQGRVSNWRTPKLMNLAVAEAKSELAMHKHAKRMRDCARRLDFITQQTPEKFAMHLKGAFACGDRFCPLCMKLKARKLVGLLSDVIEVHAEEFPRSLPILFTGTMPNVSDDDLGAAITNLLTGCRAFIRNRALTKRVKGAFRSIEVTYNRHDKTWHPHVHMILFMDEAFWRPSAGLYLPHPEWLAHWQAAMGMPDIKIVHVAKIGRDRDGVLVLGDRFFGDLAEACKYLVKVGSVLERTEAGWTADPALIAILHAALKGRRLTSLTGSLRKLRRRVALNGDPPPDDVLDGTEETYLWDRIEGDAVADYWLHMCEEA